MKRKIITVLFAILLVALSVTCFTACEPTQTEKDVNLYYAEIKDVLKTVGERYDNCNGYTYTTQSTFDGNTSRARVRETRAPVYFEWWEYLSDDWLFTPKNDLQSIVREENGQVVAYTNDRNNYYERTVLGTLNNYERPWEIFPTVYVWSEITLNIDKCDIAYKNGTYTIVTAYDDFELGDFKSLLELLLENDEKEASGKAVVTISITTTENQTTVSFATTLKIDTEGKANEREIEITTTIDFDEFNPLDFDNGEYVVLPPSDIEDVYAVTDISKPLRCGSHDSAFKVELEQGLYYFEYESAPHVTVCSADDINNALDFGLISKSVTDSNNDYKYCFMVEKSGQYYVIFKYSDYETYQIVRCPYDDLYDADNPKILRQNVTGTIEGKYDFECYSYSSDKEGLLTITNSSNTAIDIICKIPAPQYPYRTLTVPAGEALKNIPVIDGGTTLFVGKTDATQPVNYTLTTSFYQNDNGISADFDEMPWITTEFSNDYYIAGCGLSSKYVRMHVDVKGLYTFEFENLYEGLSNDMSVKVYDTDRKEVGYKYSALEAGDYIVIFYNSYDELSIAKVKYALVKVTEDFETTVTLNKISIAERNSEKARVYPLTNVENQEVIYRFTLDEESVVLFDCYIYIFDANDKPLTFGYDLDAIKLAAGEYYYMPYTYYPYYTVAIVVDYDGPVIDYGNMPVLTAGNTLVFEANDLKVAYFVIEIEHSGRYNFIGSPVRLHDENMNGVRNVPYTQSFDLDAGTYYALVINEGNQAVVKMEEAEQ